MPQEAKNGSKSPQEVKVSKKAVSDANKLEPRNNCTEREKTVFDKVNSFLADIKNLETAFYQSINEFVELISEIGRAVVDRVEKKRQSGTLEESAYSIFDKDYERIFMSNLTQTLEHFTYGLKELSRKSTENMTNLFQKELKVE